MVEEKVAGVDFDALSRRTAEPDATIEDSTDLYAATFRLPEWLFIARGEAPNFTPYIASNEAVAEGKHMIRAFTDGVRLRRFAAESGLLQENGDALILSIKTRDVIDYLEQLETDGVYGVWFNCDNESYGYFTPLKQLRPIKSHLDKLGVLVEPSGDV